MNDCECGKPAVSVPLRGLALALDLAGLPECKVIDYSTEEQFTGQHWVDGKKIYRKTVNCGRVLIDQQKLVPHGIAGMAQALRLYGFAVHPRDTAFLPHVSPVGGHASLYLRGSENIGIHALSDNWVDYADSWATIEYTCVDR